VYGSLGILIGGGAVGLHPDVDWDEGDNGDHEDVEVDGFFVAQPELALHSNLTRWMRLGATVGYRVTGAVQRFGVTESELNGVVLGGNIQFGWL
jgi:hypothetical protein